MPRVVKRSATARGSGQTTAVKRTRRTKTASTQSTPANDVQTQQEATTGMLPEDTAQNLLEITLENNIREDTTASRRGSTTQSSQTPGGEPTPLDCASEAQRDTTEAISGGNPRSRDDVATPLTREDIPHLIQQVVHGLSTQRDNTLPGKPQFNNKNWYAWLLYSIYTVNPSTHPPPPFRKYFCYPQNHASGFPLSPCSIWHHASS